MGSQNRMEHHRPAQGDFCRQPFPFPWFALLALLIYTAWVWAGLRPSFHQYGAIIACVLGASLLVGGSADGRKAILRDPLCFIGLAFLGLLTLQWLNAGRTLYLDEVLNEWRYSAPPCPGWPFAFDRAEAWQILTWFFPAWIIVLTARSPRITSGAMLRLLRWLTYSAGLLALFGLVQWFSGTKKVYGITPFDASFFASFTYRNHAASFFALTASIAAGLLGWEQRARRGRMIRRGRLLALTVSLLLCLSALLFCGSRAGLFFGLFLVLSLTGYGCFYVWRNGTRMRRFHLTAALVAVAALTLWVAATADVNRIPQRLKPLAVQRITRGYEDAGELYLSLSPALRLTLAMAAWDMWKQHPWFGVGGWGFRYLLAFHIPEEQWDTVVTRYGRANVHMDWLQFLAEFGLVGVGLMLWAGGLLTRDFVRAFRRHDPLGLMLGVGMGMVIMHSIIDLPFRCPAVLYTWLLALTALPAIEKRPVPVGSERNRPRILELKNEKT